MARSYSTKQLEEFMQTSKGKSYTVAAGTLFLVLALLFFGILPAISAILVQLDENNERVVALEQIKQKISTVRDLIEEEKSKLAVVMALDASMPSTRRQNVVIKDLDDFASARGAKVNSISFENISELNPKIAQAEANVSLLDAMNVSASFSGSREGLEALTEDLERSRRVYDIFSVSIVRADAGATYPYTMNITMNVYYWNLLLDDAGEITE